ncbi:MAG: carbon-nitrogen hydrolase family protein [Rhodoglobus sp.]
MKLRVATVQAEAIPWAVAENVKKAVRYVEQAASAGARIIVFPEAFVTGYDNAAFTSTSPNLTDVSWLSPLQGVVDEAGVVVVLNSAIHHGDRLALTDFVLSPRRDPWAAYDKQHLYESEKSIFAPGTGGASFTLDGFEVGLSVCYDANFPEHAAAAAADGAMIYVNSGAYYPGGAERRDLHNAARALDNGMYVVFSGLVGAPSDFIGGSAIFDPLGRRIASVTEHEGLAIADIDSDEMNAARANQRMWADRLPSLGERSNTKLD